MKRIILFALACFLFSNLSNAQIVQSQLKTSALVKTVNATTATLNNKWDLHLKTYIKKPQVPFTNLEAVKHRNMQTKLAQIGTPQKGLNKTTGARPTIGKSFKGNDLTSLTPSDNTIAISDSGLIVSLNNYSYSVYDTNGTAIIPPMTWNAFLGPDSVALIRGKFDPRVVYDPNHDRFIFCILHAPADTLRSSIILAFSQTNDPTQGWHIYNVDGNPLKNKSWTDYPSLGLTEHELFINANLFEVAPTWGYSGTYIQQIDLDSAYAGGTLQYKTWSGFDINKYITLVPAPDGFGRPGINKMDFVTMHPGEDTLVHLFTISDTMNAAGVNISNKQYKIPYYSACANGFIKDPSNAYVDSISTGSAWVQNAFLQDDKIHFTFSANANGYCGINYGRIYLNTQNATYSSYAEPGIELAYPALASFGHNGIDNSVALIYLRADTKILPEVAVISIDDNEVWSEGQTVKKGDTIVDILSGQPERWGDYSGIARKYNGANPEVWIYGGYAANTPASSAHPARNNGYANWIAQIKSNDAAPVSVKNTEKKQEFKVFPNPAKSIYHLTFELKKSSDVSIRLYDINGRVIKTLFEGDLPTSKNEFSFNRNALSSGQYFIQVNVDGALQTKKLILVE